MPTPPHDTWARLYRALRPENPSDMDGPWRMIVTGSVNIAGGGAGGTSMVDDNPFTPGATSVTPAAGYVGGRSVASGNAGAFGMSPSGAMYVHVLAGGAGGGLAQLQVVGTDNQNFNNVGWPSGAAIATLNTIPVMVVNQSAAGGGFASAAVYGSPAFPVYVVGSAHVVNAVQVNALGGSLQIVGSVNPHAVFIPAGSAHVIGSMGVTPLAAFSLGGVPVVDTRGSLVPTQWMITGSTNGAFVVASLPAAGRIYLYGVKIISEATVALAFQSPSGTYLEGTQQILPGAGFAENAPLGTPIITAASGQHLLVRTTGGAVGGIARGWIGP